MLFRSTEMKERILSQLYGIWIKDKDSDPYLQKITEELEIASHYAISFIMLCMNATSSEVSLYFENSSSSVHALEKS